LKFSLGHLIVVYGSGIAPFQENRSRSHSLLQSSSTCSTALISPWMLIVCFRHIFGQGEDSKRPGANLRSLSRFPASFALLSHVDLALLLGYAKLLRDW
jgi:hypothetical protein